MRDAIKSFGIWWNFYMRRTITIEINRTFARWMVVGMAVIVLVLLLKIYESGYRAGELSAMKSAYRIVQKNGAHD